MELDEILDKVTENKKITIKRIRDNDVQVFMEVDGFIDILRIYPKTKTAEFLDIEDLWEELISAVEEKYKSLPEIRKLVDYLNENKYNITF